MTEVKSVKIDGESIYLFKSAIYVFEANGGFTLELDLIVSEVAVNKYKKEDNLIVEIELADGRELQAIMHVKALAGGLPQLNLFCELDGPDDYYFLEQVNENDSWFPNLEAGLTIEEIRKVEMPVEVINLKLKLPIDQVEWLNTQKRAKINEMFKDFIYDYWKKQT